MDESHIRCVRVKQQAAIYQPQKWTHKTELSACRP
jgi:hypothetical protein